MKSVLASDEKLTAYCLSSRGVRYYWRAMTVTVSVLLFLSAYHGVFYLVLFVTSLPELCQFGPIYHAKVAWAHSGYDYLPMDSSLNCNSGSPNALIQLAMSRAMRWCTASPNQVRIILSYQNQRRE